MSIECLDTALPGRNRFNGFGVAKAWAEYVTVGSVSDTTPPPAPLTVKVTAGADGAIEVSWDAEADLFTTAVKVTISRLRRKLGDPPLIETIPQAGYRI